MHDSNAVLIKFNRIIMHKISTNLDLHYKCNEFAGIANDKERAKKITFI